MNLNFIEPLRSPVSAETRELLRLKWRELPEGLRTPRQLYGRQDEGCGATVGVMPRCDFSCQGCYLSADANSVRPESLAGIKSQMRTLRSYLGQWGNLQLTDGEVTLLDAESLIELLRYARQLELVPMLMTHGETFLRKPELLAKLMVDGGLREISIHVDTTQRGRRHKAYRDAASEAELNPLRDEFAKMIRRVRKETRRPLRAASTVTVTNENIRDVPEIVSWFVQNSDAFRLLSFLPVAQVGRTATELDGIDTDKLWQSIGAGLPDRPGLAELTESQWWLGHSACSRILSGLVCDTRNSGPTFRRFSPDNPDDQTVFSQIFERVGGITFRGDSILRAVLRFFGVLLRHPRLILVTLPQYAWRWLKRFDDRPVRRLMLRLATGRSRIRRLTIVSHHFMNPDELKTPAGQERLAQCAFKVPVDGRLVSMCQFNAAGGRDAYYASLNKPNDQAKTVRPLDSRIWQHEPVYARDLLNRP